MGKNKIIYGGQTLIDLTADTVDAEHLAEGYTAHDKAGEPIVGTMSGGGDDHTTEDAILTRTLSGNYYNDRITALGNYALYGCNGLTSVNVPNVETLEDTALQSCANLESIIIPKVRALYYSTFYNSGAVKFVDTKSVNSMNANLKNALNLKYFLLRGPLAQYQGSEGYDPTNPGFHLYVPRALVESYKNAPNWSRLADKVRALEDFTVDGTVDGALDFEKTDALNALTISGGVRINLYRRNTLQLNINYDPVDVSEAQKGVTWSVSGNATITQDGLVTATGSAGDTITVTATSVYNPTIQAVQSIAVVNAAPSYSIDLNDGQWVDSGTLKDGNVVYKSDKGSYKVNNGKSIATITVDGYTEFTFYIRSYAESSYDYTEAFAIDTEPTRQKGLYTTRSKQSQTDYVKCDYTLDGGTHTIAIMYSKDSSGDTADDRGYFYIPEQ